MNNKNMTLEQIRFAGIELLEKHLGAIAMVRFLQQSELGWGDYTKDRHRWLGNPKIDTLVKNIKSESNN